MIVDRDSSRHDVGIARQDDRVGAPRQKRRVMLRASITSNVPATGRPIIADLQISKAAGSLYAAGTG
jgi:hypothetical protein